MTSFRRPFSQFKDKGFALISTIVILSLLTLIALGAISLSVQETKLAGSGKYQTIAETNARLALQMAIAKLQENAGPDQRITATASILEDPSATTTIPNPNWVGVWRSDAYKNDPTTNAQPIIHRSEDTAGSKVGSLIDRRSDGSFIPEEQVLNWLVSSSSTPNPLTDLPSDRKITLVGEGSTNIPEDHIFAERITISNGGIDTGSYAYWVGDEGVKARFDLTKITPSASPPYITTTPEQAGLNIITGFENYETLPSSTFEKIITRNTTDVSGIADLNSTITSRKDHFHDLSFTSLSVLSDTREGKLKRNLTAFLKSSGQSPALLSRSGLADQDPILNNPKLDIVSPKFGLLRKWAQIADSNTNSSIDIIAPKNIDNGTDWGWNKSFHYPGSGIDLSNQDTPPIHPVIIDAGISFGASLEKTTGSTTPGISTYKVNLHYFPRIALYNPYNVKLNAEKYVVQLKMPHRFFVNIIVPGEQSKRIQLLESYHEGYVGENLPHRPHFSIPSTAFEPGEALLFTADPSGAANGSKFWGEPNTSMANSLDNFALSSNQPAPLIANFYVKTRATVEIPDSKFQNAAYQMEMKKEGSASIGYKHYFYKLYQHKGSDNTVDNVRSNPTSFPPLQFFNQSENGTAGSDAPWFVQIPASNSSPLREITRPVTAYYRFKWGHRFQWMDDTIENQTIKPGPWNAPYLGYNIIANHNLRAGWHQRSTVENSFRASSAAGRYTHGVAIDDPYGWDWNDPSLYPVPVGGKNRVSPFGRPANYAGQTFPILDVPSKDTPLVSLGSFQHAPLSQFVWHPTNAFGNSLADARVPRDQSSNYFSKNDWSLLGNTQNNDWSRARQANANTALDDQTNLYDLSYETNFELWDKFFLAPIPADASFEPGDPLTNPRLITVDNPTAEELSDYHTAAKHLMTKGAFNVNSTSEPAWAALIASFRNNPEYEIILEDGSKIKANDVYSRFLKPYNDKYDNQSDTDSATWKSYRQLTDTQILALAKEIVIEVKQRGPFISLADFVNRRLITPPATSSDETGITQTGLKGTLQAAIDRTSINNTLLNSHIIPKEEYFMRPNFNSQVTYGNSYPDPTFPVQNGNPTFGAKPDHNQWADSKLVGAPAFLTQADMLQKLGPVLTARSDTFTIRAYGEAKDTSGRIVSRAWCEAIVQRTPTPIVPDDTGLDPIDSSTTPADSLGRKFIIKSFR